MTAYMVQEGQPITAPQFSGIMLAEIIRFNGEYSCLARIPHQDSAAASPGSPMDIRDNSSDYPGREGSQ